MRLKSRIWIDATLRRCAGEGKFGAVIDIGADEAGAVYIFVNHLDGTYDLLAPPPGSSHNEQGERIFVKVFETPTTWQEAKAKLDRQKKFDPDIWSVEIEDRTGLAGLKIIVP